MSVTITNLNYLLNDRGEVLLQYKRKGFGTGKWNGPGGKARPGETMAEAAIRETFEETGLTMIAPEKGAEMEFRFKNQADWDQDVHVYVCRNYSGELKASEEGELTWFKIDELPFKEMWEDDPFWLKRVLGGEFVKMRFTFNQEGKLLNHENL